MSHTLWPLPPGRFGLSTAAPPPTAESPGGRVGPLIAGPGHRAAGAAALRGALFPVGPQDRGAQDLCSTNCPSEEPQLLGPGRPRPSLPCQA